ncbi:hypothetical protein COCMIDRAFT_21751 [Bipolaris oryzae ATCC 44560]|uniref:Uncharacterized protein n=1 Tax=Bipolaris oryzae ATCC 44560 TaxID=930090 RepID=W6ZKZ9_COCMI|nr:uncharacterized protein COCMIDRAFT_21751 [Bipolaris oryzae ATCC 44560]EUC50735.1 hypothetical protein COCMIDRAFT_21751 [Bipolaris oryzae ATCC 44560]
MTGVSVTSTAVSFLNKLRGKSNPYEKAHHTRSNITSPNDTTNQPRNIVPQNDLLAEAREAAGLDRVTGRRRTHVAVQTPHQQQLAVHGTHQTPAEQKAAYLAWAAQRPQERGQPYGSYEEFVREMIEKRDGRRDPAGGLSSYYAPERRVEEYYYQAMRD